MSLASILELIPAGAERRTEAGEVLIEQGTCSGQLFFLIEGEVEVVKDDVPVAKASQPGAVFGELSALLGGHHTATVRALRPSTFHVVENPRAFLEASPRVCLHVCELVARRLDTLNKYLVDVKQQYEGHDHLGMVDKVIETLMHRQAPPRIRPSESTIRESEPAD